MKFRELTNKFYKNRNEIIENKIKDNNYLEYLKAMLQSLIKLKDKNDINIIETTRLFLREMYQQDIHTIQVELFIDNLHNENIDKFIEQWKLYYKMGFTHIII